ncbi:MAG: peptidyl-prolyl cis-trans isomerase [Bdellovibrio sp.]|nr:peptidyl-prolyl cis-trans isomerase [Bdellovibrio sp.]
MKVRASHILVQHQYEAEDILRALQAGKSFEDMAKKFSKCPSATQGGDLGYFKRGRMDEDFEDHVFALQVGQTSSKPVRTKFGYHLIKRTA